MKREHTRNMLCIITVCGFAWMTSAATITYTYDAQHRLVQASYSASEKAFINYDAAGNVEQQIVITDAKYLQSWLWYFSMLGYPGYPLSNVMGLLAENT